MIVRNGWDMRTVVHSHSLRAYWLWCLALLLPHTIGGSGFNRLPASAQFSHERGFYDAPFNLTVTPSSTGTGTTIRYTTDGTTPSLSNGSVYSAPIAIKRTTVIRAAAFVEGADSIHVDTRTYIFVDDVIRQSPDGAPPPGWPKSWGKNIVDYGMDPKVVDDPEYSSSIKSDLKTIPSISVVMKLDDLFDSTTGIYANADKDGGDWERPASIELITPDSGKGFQINAGIRIRGGHSRSASNPKHAFRFFFREKYGAAKLEYPLFGDKGAKIFDKMDLRAAQNYSWSFKGDAKAIFIRDQFSRDAQLAMGHQGERGDFYHLYINGVYWGLFNTCERPEASYGASYFGGSADDYDVVKVSDTFSAEATDGNLEAWTRLWRQAVKGFASDSSYFSVQGMNADGTPNPAHENLLDVDNLIDYMLIVLYGGNLDAPISKFHENDYPNNWYGVRNRTGKHGGFRFFIHDAEHTLLDANADRTGIVDGKPGQIDEDWTAGNPLTGGGLDTAFATSNPQYIWFRLQENAKFRQRVAERVERHFFNKGVFTPEGARALFLARKNEIDRAVVGESARWGDAQGKPGYTRKDWLIAIDSVLTNFIPQRTEIVLNQLRADGLYPVKRQSASTARGLALPLQPDSPLSYHARLHDVVEPWKLPTKVFVPLPSDRVLLRSPRTATTGILRVK